MTSADFLDPRRADAMRSCERSGAAFQELPRPRGTLFGHLITVLLAAAVAVAVVWWVQS